MFYFVVFFRLNMPICVVLLPYVMYVIGPTSGCCKRPSADTRSTTTSGRLCGSTTSVQSKPADVSLAVCCGVADGPRWNNR